MDVPKSESKNRCRYRKLVIGFRAEILTLTQTFIRISPVELPARLALCLVSFIFISQVGPRWRSKVSLFLISLAADCLSALFKFYFRIGPFIHLFSKSHPMPELLGNGWTNIRHPKKRSTMRLLFEFTS